MSEWITYFDGDAPPPLRREVPGSEGETFTLQVPAGAVAPPLPPLAAKGKKSPGPTDVLTQLRGEAASKEGMVIQERVTPSGCEVTVHLSTTSGAPAQVLVVRAMGDPTWTALPRFTLEPGARAIVPTSAEAERQLKIVAESISAFNGDLRAAILGAIASPSLPLRMSRVEQSLSIRPTQAQPASLPHNPRARWKLPVVMAGAVALGALVTSGGFAAFNHYTTAGASSPGAPAPVSAPVAAPTQAPATPASAPPSASPSVAENAIEVALDGLHRRLSTKGKDERGKDKENPLAQFSVTHFGPELGGQRLEAAIYGIAKLEWSNPPKPRQAGANNAENFSTRFRYLGPTGFAKLDAESRISMTMLSCKIWNSPMLRVADGNVPLMDAAACQQLGPASQGQGGNKPDPDKPPPASALRVGECFDEGHTCQALAERFVLSERIDRLAAPPSSSASPAAAQP